MNVEELAEIRSRFNENEESKSAYDTVYTLFGPLTTLNTLSRVSRNIELFRRFVQSDVKLYQEMDIAIKCAKQQGVIMKHMELNLYTVASIESYKHACKNDDIIYGMLLIIPKSDWFINIIYGGADSYAHRNKFEHIFECATFVDFDHVILVSSRELTTRELDGHSRIYSPMIMTISGKEYYMLNATMEMVQWYAKSRPYYN